MMNKLNEVVGKILGSRKWLIGIVVIVLYLSFGSNNPVWEKVLQYTGLLIGVEGLGDIASRLKSGAGK